MKSKLISRRAVTAAGLVAAISAVLTMTAAPAGALLGSAKLVDGGFESPAIHPSVFQSYSAGENVGSWQVTAGSVELIHNSFWQAAEGEQSLDLNGFEPGTISQNVATSPLTMYQVSFALAGNPDHQGLVTGALKANGETIKNFSFDTTGMTKSSMGYVTQKATFLATGQSTKLSFSSTTPDGPSGAVIDNVRIRTCLLVLCP